MHPVTAKAANSSSVVNYALSTVGVNGWKGLCLGYVSHCFNTCYGFSSSACCAYAYGTNFLDSTSRTDIPLGADVFFAGSNVTCGNHKAGHVGIYVGDDSIVHAWAGKIVKMKIDDVIRCGYPYRGWGWHGNVPLDTQPPSSNPDDYQQVSQDLYFRAGNVMTGTQVGYVQAVLKYLGYNIVIDQSYGPATRDVVKQFQSDNGLTVDGSCGPQTRAKLIEIYQQRKNPTPSHETKAPEIRDIKVTDISKDGYTVSCCATDESGIDRVQFPTWTDYNDKDDILPDWETNPAATGTRDGDVFTYRVNISDHNYEQGTYRTHIYAYDRYGNYDSDDTICVEIPVNSDVSDLEEPDLDKPVTTNPSETKFADGVTAETKLGYFQVISAKEKTAKLIRVKNKKAGKLSIPAKVKIQGMTCKVTEIGANIMKGNTRLTKVVLSEYVAGIGKNAFSGCRKLKAITVKGTALKTIKSGAFKKTSAKLKVSAKNLSKKKKTELQKKMRKAGNKKITVK